MPVALAKRSSVERLGLAEPLSSLAIVDWQSMRAALALSPCLLLATSLVVAQTAPAPPAPPSGHYDFSIRPGFGGGLGEGGIALRLGLASELWPTEYIGIGATGTLSYKVSLGGDFRARSFALLGVVRTAAQRHYWMFGAGIGPAVGDYSPTDAECPDADASCPRHGTVLTVPVVLGWLSHPGGGPFECGPVVRLDIFADPRGRIPSQYFFTINMELGAALFNE
jgi:hypothetical protein